MTLLLEPYRSPNFFRRKRHKLNRSDIFSPKDEAKQALKVEIKSRIEKRQAESNLKVTNNKRSPFLKKVFSKDSMVGGSFQNNSTHKHFDKPNSSQKLNCEQKINSPNRSPSPKRS